MESARRAREKQEEEEAAELMETEVDMTPAQRLAKIKKKNFPTWERL